MSRNHPYFSYFCQSRLFCSGATQADNVMMEPARATSPCRKGMELPLSGRYALAIDIAMSNRVSRSYPMASRDESAQSMAAAEIDNFPPPENAPFVLVIFGSFAFF